MTIPQPAFDPARRPDLPPEVAAEIDGFESEVRRFQDGDLAPERFRAFRLGHGIYGQRQPGVQMVRVKIPGGALTGRQLARLADVSEAFGVGRTHLTTRQDVQFHFVPLDRVPQVMRVLAEVGLTTREACGNSVRNVTACPLAGFLAEEAFDVRPYAAGTFAYLVRNAFCQQLARKFKIAFSACPEDCAATAIHDIGASGRVARDGPRLRYGFRLVVGGGLGATPFVAQTLEEFVPVEDLLPAIRAILEVFSQHGNRRQKTRARLKFVVHKVGIDAFRGQVAEALASMTRFEREEADLRRHVPEDLRSILGAHLDGLDPEEPPAGGFEATFEAPLGAPAAGPVVAAARRRSAAALLERARISAAHPGPGKCAAPSLDGGFLRWASCSVRAQKDPNRAIVTVLVPLGDLEAPRLRSLAALVTRDGEDQVRVGRDQNLVLPSVRASDLPALYEGLAAAGLAEPGAGTALDVTACPGADTCSLGITSSKGLTRALREEMAPLGAGEGIEDLRGLTIKISGCPNSCGQHHVASIGLHGVVKKIRGRMVPAYQVHLGGRAAAGDARIGEALEKIPARSVPGAVAALIALLRRERRDAEPLASVLARLPREALAAALAPFAEALPEGESGFVDWGRTEPFSTDEIGAGECAGAGTDAAVNPFDNYEAEILQARLFMERAQWADALANLNRSQYTLARVLLEAIGKKPDSDYEVACELRAQVIDRGLAGEGWNLLHAAIAEALRPRRPDPETVRRIHGLAAGLLDEATRVLPLLGRRAAAASAEIPG